MVTIKRHYKMSKRFGIAGGVRKLHRNSVRPSVGKPRKTAYTYKSALLAGKNIILRVHRKRYVKPSRKLYLRLRHFNSSVQGSSTDFSMRKMTGNESSLNFKFTKIKPVNINGYRLVNLDCLESHVMTITMHVATCESAKDVVSKGESPIKLVSELRTMGLASVLLAKCQGCQKTFQFETSPKLKSQSSVRYDVNVRAVWGCVVTGNGASHLNEILGTLDSPGISRPAFSSIEQQIGDWWEEVLARELMVAGAEERRIAIEKEDFDEGIPSITVIADGGWCKRSHKHSYNALGGVGVIIGKETGKLLHIGVRNKYCYICTRAKNEGIVPATHHCFQNWHESSQAMEADIIVDGFRKAESRHGLRYMKLVGDGDSSVFARIQEDVPVWGQRVQKIECANHVCKCLRSSLEKLVDGNPQYKGKDKLTKATRIRIVSAVRCAIRMRSKEPGKRKAAKILAHDIRNSIHHVFGRHTNCSSFCKAGESQDDDRILEASCLPDESDTSPTTCDPGGEMSESMSSCCSEQAEMWTEGSSLQSQEQSRYRSNLSYGNLDNNILSDVTLLLNRVADKSSRLLGNTTTNLAESWMHMRTKFDGGKLYNICARGSWSTRCYGGSLRLNLGPQWSPTAWQQCTGTVPGYHFQKVYSDRDRELAWSTVSKDRPQASAYRWKRKMATVVQNSTKKARESYGKEAADVPDLSCEDLEAAKTDYLQKHINISQERIDAIERLTREQSLSTVWKDERRKRITASKFGAVVKRNVKIRVEPLVRNLLYGTFKGNKSTTRGLNEERVTIQEYILRKADSGMNVTVEGVGLIVSNTHKFLGGSPDGRVTEVGGETGLIEIKNLLHDKPVNLNQAARDTSFCLALTKDQNLTLKRRHIYYYQCQGLLGITQLPWIDFVVRTVNPYQLSIERIGWDQDFWVKTMLPKLTAFYNNVILMELCAPRKGKSPGIREPGVWFEPSTDAENHQPCRATTVSNTSSQAGRNRPKRRTNAVYTSRKSAPTATTRRFSPCVEHHSDDKVVVESAKENSQSASHRILPTSFKPSTHAENQANTLSETSSQAGRKRPQHQTNAVYTSRKSAPTATTRRFSPCVEQHSDDEVVVESAKENSQSVSHRILPTLSDQTVEAASSSSLSRGSATRSLTRRSARFKMKFVGRRISYKNTDTAKWCDGTVLGVISGTDGDVNAVYEVLVDGEDDNVEVDYLCQDSVKFIDL